MKTAVLLYRGPVTGHELRTVTAGGTPRMRELRIDSRTGVPEAPAMSVWVRLALHERNPFLNRRDKFHVLVDLEKEAEAVRSSGGRVEYVTVRDELRVTVTQHDSVYGREIVHHMGAGYDYEGPGTAAREVPLLPHERDAMLQGAEAAGLSVEIEPAALVVVTKRGKARFPASAGGWQEAARSAGIID